jgi:hypothetical protein
VSEDSIQVILLKLQHLEDTLCQVHNEVKKTNGRVTELEMTKARDEGAARHRASFTTILTMSATYLLVALIVWFVAHSYNS